MKPKIDVMRAVMHIVATRVIWLGGIIALIIAIIVLAIIWALAYFVSGWWWLLLIMYVPLVLITLGVFLLARFVAHRLYPRPLNREQKKLLGNFVDKIQRLIETRGMGWWLFALLNFKDLLFHRDLRTTKELIHDTTSLKRDFAELEKKLQT